MTRRKVHADATQPGAMVSRGACGFFAVEVTREPGHVTCRSCMAVLHREREAIPEYIDDRWFLEATSKPLPQGELSTRDAKLWKHVLEGIARTITEPNEQARARLLPGQRAPFSSVRDAISRYVVTRLDGYAQASVGDPDRIKRLTGALGSSTTPAGQIESRATLQAELSAEVERAIQAAFPRDWERPPVPREICTEILVLHVVGRRTLREVAEDVLERRDYAVPLDTVGRIARHGRSAVQEWLWARGMMPNERGAVIEPDEASGENMIKHTESDLFGWAQIADFLGESQQTARRWASKYGMPVSRFLDRRVEARREELAEWRRSMVSGATGRSGPRVAAE